MTRLALLVTAAGLALAPAAGAADGCQALSPGMNTLKGVLTELGGEPGPQFALRLERPLCGARLGPAGHTLALAFADGAPRRFVGRRVLVSGTLAPAKASSANRLLLQVGSFTPLPQVAANVS